MLIVIHLSHACDVPCDRCGWLDSLGGVELSDDTGTHKCFCHSCTLELLRKCLPVLPVSRSAPLPRAVAS
jgi:hypothetical protein